MKLSTEQRKAIKAYVRNRYTYSNFCGYIYEDKIEIWECKYKKGTRSEKTYTIEGTFPFNVTSPNGQKPKRIIVHDPSVLLDGLTHVSIYWGNTSENMRNQGISCDTLTLYTDSGMRIEEHVFPFITSNLLPQL